ncbi:MAG: hypothetical protein EOO15_16770 [Chitinophagaceae bacterium]|nr:MAG: hypothetical protein EOO15_16770 [Chitinophagaceae bacterium]
MTIPANTSSPNAEPVPVSDRGNAPIVFFDGCAGLGHYGGIYHVGLGAVKHVLKTTDSATPNAEIVMVAFLRTNKAGMITLRDSINAALLLAEPTEGQNN